MGLLASGPGAVVVVVELVAGTPVVVVGPDPGTVVEGVGLTGGFTAKLEPVTTTTSGDVERVDPTSMVFVVVVPDPGPEPFPIVVLVVLVVLAVSPGS